MLLSRRALGSKQCSGGSKGGRKGRTPPVLARNFCIFMQFSGKISQIIDWRPLWAWRPLVWEILDPQLQCAFYSTLDAELQWRIQDFPEEGSNLQGAAKILFDQFFPKTA